ncbi:HCNGP-domain-containing protein [Lichtheimia hyalospora FSU 10163]|nr:HCNGP-domain-containing protein [Lichtheimia hyalospora FSU 10163]
MSALSALANYSDDEEEEETEEIETTTIATSELKAQSPSQPPPPEPHSSSTQLGITHDKSSSSPLATKSTTSTARGNETTETKDDPERVPEAVRRHLASADKTRQRRLALMAKAVDGVDNWGIPAEPTTECDPDLLETITHFQTLHKSGHRLNEHLQSNKAFRNPRIYAKLVEFIDLDEIGSNFDKETFDPHGFPKEAYIDGLLEAQRQYAEEKAAAQQNRTNISFVSSTSTGSSATGTSNPAQSAALSAAMANAAKVANRITQQGQATTSKRESSSPLSSREHNSSSTNSKRSRR